MYVGAGLSLLAGFLTGTMREAFQAEVERQSAVQGGDAAQAAEFLDSFFGVIVVVSIVFGVVFAGLWIMIAVHSGRGRNWARITGTVLGGLYVLSFLGSLLQPSSGVLMAVSVLTVLVVIATIVLLWLRPSNEFFAAAGAAGRAGR